MSYHILYFRRIPILSISFYISYANRYFLSHFIVPTHTVTFYLILYFRHIPILPITYYISDAHQYFLPHLYFRFEPILFSTFYISDSYLYFLPHIIFTTHTDTIYTHIRIPYTIFTSYYILYF